VFSPNPGRDSEVQQMIEVVMRALAVVDLPAMVIGPSADVTDSRSSFAQLCLAKTAGTPGQRSN